MIQERTANTGLAKVAVRLSRRSRCIGMVLRINPPDGGFQIKFCGKSPTLRIAAKR
jgi:hypothetical protein